MSTTPLTPIERSQIERAHVGAHRAVGHVARLRLQQYETNDKQQLEALDDVAAADLEQILLLKLLEHAALHDTTSVNTQTDV